MNLDLIPDKHVIDMAIIQGKDQLIDGKEIPFIFLNSSTA